jgi:hypothetical protein
MNLNFYRLSFFRKGPCGCEGESAVGNSFPGRVFHRREGDSLPAVCFTQPREFYKTFA